MARYIGTPEELNGHYVAVTAKGGGFSAEGYVIQVTPTYIVMDTGPVNSGRVGFRFSELDKAIVSYPSPMPKRYGAERRRRVRATRPAFTGRAR